MLLSQVPLPYLRANDKLFSSSVAVTTSGHNSTPSLLDDGFVVPLHLRPLATDSEEQAAKKKKKIKSLKHANKKVEAESIVNSKQASWSSFVKKNAGKRVKGTISGKVKYFLMGFRQK